MPNAFDRCGSCGQPVYFEDNVVGGCGCGERGFRIMLAQQRQRNNSGNPDFAGTFMQASQAGQAPDLGQIDPGVLMSAAGRSEFNFARQASGQTFQPPVRGPVGRTMLEQNSPFGPPADDVFALEPMDAPQEEEVSFEDDDGDWTGLSSQEPQRHTARIASVARRMDEVDLAAMWMQTTGIPFDRSQLVAPGGDGFQFDAGEINLDALPRGGGGGGRFRVDAPPPRRPAFNRELVNSQGPMREGARVRGFAVLREEGPGAYRPPPPPPPPVYRPEAAEIRAAVPESAPRTQQRPPMVSAIQQARQIQAKAKAPSVYDLLRKK